MQRHLQALKILVLARTNGLISQEWSQLEPEVGTWRETELEKVLESKKEENVGKNGDILELAIMKGRMAEWDQGLTLTSIFHSSLENIVIACHTQ